MQNMHMNKIVVWCLPFLQSRDSSLIEIAEFVEITEKTELILRRTFSASSELKSSLQPLRNRRIRRNFIEMTELIQSVDPSPTEIAEFGEITEMTELIQSRIRPSELLQILPT